MPSISLILAFTAGVGTPVGVPNDGTLASAVGSVAIKVSNHDRNEGSSQLELAIDPSGSIVKCTEQGSSIGGLYRVEEILDRLCPVLQHKFRFIPARGEDGKAIAGRYWLGVGFSIKEGGAQNGMLPLKLYTLSQDPEEYRDRWADQKSVDPLPRPVVLEMTDAHFKPQSALTAFSATIPTNHWNADNIRYINPIGDAGSWLSEWHLPEGKVPPGDYYANVRLGVGPKGVPYSCEFAKPFGIDALDQHACALLMQRARFFPGRDARRNPVGGIWMGQFRWIVPIPKDEPTAVDGMIAIPPPIAPVVPVIAPPPPPSPRPTPKVAPRAAHPRSDAGSWISNADYPPTLRNGEAGITSFEVVVGPDGRVSACRITQSSGTAQLDALTCSLMTRRGRFIPANDSQGTPISGKWKSRVRWMPPPSASPSTTPPTQ